MFRFMLPGGSAEASICGLTSQRQRAVSVVAGFVGIVSSLAAQAQQVPQLPTREEIQQPAPQTSLPSGERIVAIDDELERAPCALVAPQFENVRFVLRNVVFSGGEALDPALLEASWSDKAGQDLHISAICEIRDRAATALRAKGYLAAVQLPEQTIERGVVQLDILTARMSQIELIGDVGANEGLLRRYLARLEAQPVFNIIEAERYLLLARDIPGMDARLTLRPGGVPGEVIGEVAVSHTPVFLDASVQNYGARDIGRWAGIARIRGAGLTGLGDMTTASFYATPDVDRLQVLQLAHEFRVGGEGLRFGASYTQAWNRPDLHNVGVESESRVINLFGSYPLTLTQARRTVLTGGLDFIDQDLEFGNAPLARDRLRVVNMRLDTSWIDKKSVTGRNGYNPVEPFWSLDTSLEARKGLKGLGASDDCGSQGLDCFAPGAVPLTRIEGQPDAFVLRGYANAEWRPYQQITLSASPRAQWASDPLLSYEEFSGGNFTIGRGFDPGTIIGDHGAALALEARYGSLMPTSRTSLTVQPFAFFDAGWVWNEDSAFAGLSPHELYSTGGGVRVIYGGMGRLEATFAVPLNRGGFLTETPDPRLLVSVTTQFGMKGR